MAKPLQDEPATDATVSAAATGTARASEPSASDATTTARGAATTAAMAPGAQPHAFAEAEAVGFAAGQVVADRYRVVRYIARGAMGEVYEVEDTVLNGHIALKTIRAEIAASRNAADRFRREIALSRRITHPNVCRIYDIGLHEGGPEQGRVVFLTMELLDGESLSKRISRHRRYSPLDALQILEQIAAGLDAAHANGIIHRDLKSGNVMLAHTGTAGTGPGERAVVTDFGLARTMSSEAHSSLSESSALVGTPAYMAPEQVEGLPLTPAADVYALGIVAYEMLTGRRPFDGGSAMSVAARRLTMPPPPPSTHVPDMDRAVEGVILRCLERDPSLRFNRAGAFVSALRDAAFGGIAGGAASGSAAGPAASERANVTGVPVPGSVPGSTAPVPGPVAVAPSAPRWTARQMTVLLGAVVVALGLGAAAWRLRIVPQQPAAQPSPVLTAAPIVARKAVAVLPPSDTSGAKGTTWLSTAIEEMVGVGMASGGRVRVCSGDEVARVAGTLATGALAPGTLRQAATALGVGAIVSGSFTHLDEAGGLVKVELTMHDGTSGQPLASGSATGDEGHLAELIGRAVVPLRAALGEGPPAAAEFLRFEQSLPNEPGAARAYAQGLQLMRSGESSAAVRELEQAARLSPNHPFILGALAGAWRTLGSSAQAEETARAAAAAALRLPEEMRLLVEAQTAEASLDWPRALEACQSLLRLTPDDPEVALRLAVAQSESGRPRDALLTLDGLGQARSDDARVALTRARVHRKLAEAEPMLAAARKAVQQATAHGSRGIIAAARLAESSACLALGRHQEAQAAALEARRIFTEIRDRSGAARSLEAVALSVQATGDRAGAQKIFERALKEIEAVGDKASAARVLNNLGRIHWELGRPRDADRLYERSLALYRELGATREMAHVLQNIGARLHTAGDLPAARKRYTEALGLFEKTADRGGLALTLTNLGELLFAQAELAESRRLHEESLAVNRELGDRANQAWDLTRLGEVALQGGDLLIAERRFSDAAALDQELGDPIGVALTQVGRARIRVARGEAAEAARLAAAAEEVARAEGDAETRARALLATAEAALAAGKADQARTAIADAAKVASESEQPALGLMADLLAARAALASAPAARRTLADVAKRAAARGQTLIALDARVEAVRVQPPRTAADRAAVAALQAELQRRGLGLLERRLTAN